jgi:eukaryotic-like serine/threonine-protein kinase
MLDAKVQAHRKKPSTTVRAEDISTGDDMVSEESRARDKDHVLDALGKVATVRRHRLGESLGSIQKLDTPLGQATTTSLEAFRALGSRMTRRKETRSKIHSYDNSNGGAGP